MIESKLPHTPIILFMLNKQNVKTIITVDGGINDETGELCVQKGVDTLVSASYIHKDIVNNINTLKKLA